MLDSHVLYSTFLPVSKMFMIKTFIKNKLIKIIDTGARNTHFLASQEINTLGFELRLLECGDKAAECHHKVLC